MKMILLLLGVAGVSVGGSLSVNHFPYSLFVTIPAGLLIGIAAGMFEAS